MSDFPPAEPPQQNAKLDLKLFRVSQRLTLQITFLASEIVATMRRAEVFAILHQCPDRPRIDVGVGQNFRRIDSARANLARNHPSRPGAATYWRSERNSQPQSEALRFLLPNPHKNAPVCANAQVAQRRQITQSRSLGAGGETRTLTMLPSGDFESPASTIPPHRHSTARPIPAPIPPVNPCRAFRACVRPAEAYCAGALRRFILQTCQLTGDDPWAFMTNGPS